MNHKPKFIEILKYFGIDPSTAKEMNQEQILIILKAFYSSIEFDVPKYNMIQIEGLD